MNFATADAKLNGYASSFFTAINTVNMNNAVANIAQLNSSL